jgi:hypothetical protein
MNFGISILDLVRKLRDESQDYLVPAMILGLAFLGPAVCTFVARLTRSMKPWCIKLASLMAAYVAVAEINVILYRWIGQNLIWCVWPADLFFVLFVLNWLRTPMLQLRAGSADGLDDKIEKGRRDGWNMLIFRWIPSTGVHRGLLTKRTN